MFGVCVSEGSSGGTTGSPGKLEVCCCWVFAVVSDIDDMVVVMWLGTNVLSCCVIKSRWYTASATMPMKIERRNRINAVADLYTMSSRMVVGQPEAWSAFEDSNVEHNPLQISTKLDCNDAELPPLVEIRRLSAIAKQTSGDGSWPEEKGCT